MTVYGLVLPGAAGIARSAQKTENLSEQASQRLKVLDWCRAHGNNQSLTSRHFGMGRESIREWQRRLNQSGPAGLNDRSRRPHHMRQPTVRRELTPEIVRLRKEYPTYSKYKLHALAGKKGSPSTVGRILKIRQLIDPKISRKRQKAATKPKRRFPKGMSIHAAGELVQMDTKHIVDTDGHKLYQFTAIDVLTKQRVLSVCSSESSRNGARFLDECLKRLPGGVSAVQTDNGAPFQKEFEKHCQELGITHYFTLPRSPKQNSYVEISHGADEREFYQQGKRTADITLMRRFIVERERIWNKVRPHQALAYKTPDQYYEEIKSKTLPTKDTIVLQT